jgi:ribosomal protein L37AE/L43A
MPEDPSQWDPEETMMALSDVLTDVTSGRTEGHACPRCERAKLSCGEEDGWVKIRCPQCGLSFEGMLG